MKCEIIENKYYHTHSSDLTQLSMEYIRSLDHYHTPPATLSFISFSDLDTIKWTAAVSLRTIVTDRQNLILLEETIIINDRPVNAEMSLLLSSDAKPRLKWTQELHQVFVNAVDQLGGVDKATPKALMKAMDIEGLTMYHLKSHLQKYRMSRSARSRSSYGHKPEGDDFFTMMSRMQTDVDRKFHEQIEVQRHMQLRIEAQGKYLRSVLRKACDALSDYNLCSEELKHARIQLSQLESIFDSTCLSSTPPSVLTESESSMSKDKANELSGRNNRSSTVSSCASEESIATMNQADGINENKGANKATEDGENRDFIDLNLFDSSPEVI